MPNQAIQDLLIIGGGINGAGLAAEAAARGLKVTLLEQGDLGCATSSASSGFIHGGLRYLEQYEFKLVRHALAEREVLLKKAPHLIHPLTFILPYEKSMRPQWMMRCGLWLYDHLAKRQTLAKSAKVALQSSPFGQPLKTEFSTGFSYTDCQVDDARLVIANAQAAKRSGAAILVKTCFLSAQAMDGLWQVNYQHINQGSSQQLKTRAVINISGPWLKQVRSNITGGQSTSNISLVKGSHIVIPPLYPEHFAYILQNDDGRIIFIAPYHGKTMIGTTDIAFTGDVGQVQISKDEILYLCKAVNRYLKQAINPDDVLSTWSGVRALYDDGSGNPSEVTRDYFLEQEHIEQCPLISVFGGKITTYRVLAEEILKQLDPYFPQLTNQTNRDKQLPGGELGNVSWSCFCQSILEQYKYLPEELMLRYLRQYGSDVSALLMRVSCLADLGEEVLPNLYAREIDYLCQHEWAQTAEDILWRRTKLGLELPKEAEEKLDNYISYG